MVWFGPITGEADGDEKGYGTLSQITLHVCFSGNLPPITEKKTKSAYYVS